MEWEKQFEGEQTVIWDEPLEFFKSIDTVVFDEERPLIEVLSFSLFEQMIDRRRNSFQIQILNKTLNLLMEVS